MLDRSSTREPQYHACFDVPPVTLGRMTGAACEWNPPWLLRNLAHYHFVAQEIAGAAKVAEIGCGDAFGARIVRQTVGHLHLYDFDSVWRDDAIKIAPFTVHDIVADGRLYPAYDAIYALDVLEHIAPEDEPKAMRNICHSLKTGGVFIAGCPSLESQAYATDIAKAGHVNCRTGADFRRDMLRYFEAAHPFSMNDGTLLPGFSPMSWYLIMLCSHPRSRDF